MEDPKIIDSPLSGVVEEHDVTVKVLIYRLEDTQWSLEVVAENGTSTVWDDLFATDDSALAEALRAIKEDGIESFSGEDQQTKTVH